MLKHNLQWKHLQWFLVAEGFPDSYNVYKSFLARKKKSKSYCGISYRAYSRSTFRRFGMHIFPQCKSDVMIRTYSCLRSFHDDTCNHMQRRLNEMQRRVHELSNLVKAMAIKHGLNGIKMAALREVLRDIFNQPLNMIPSISTLDRWMKKAVYGALFVLAEKFHDPNLKSVMLHGDEATLLKTKVNGTVLSFLTRDNRCETLPCGMKYVASGDTFVVVNKMMESLADIEEACYLSKLPVGVVKSSINFFMRDSKGGCCDKLLSYELPNLKAGVDCLKHAQANCLQTVCNQMSLMQSPGLTLLCNHFERYKNEPASLIVSTIIARKFSLGESGTDADSLGICLRNYLTERGDSKAVGLLERNLFEYKGNRWNDKLKHAYSLLRLLNQITDFLFQRVISKEKTSEMANFEENYVVKILHLKFRAQEDFPDWVFVDFEVKPRRVYNEKDKTALLATILFTYKSEITGQLASFNVYHDFITHPLHVLLSNSQKEEHILNTIPRLDVINALQEQLVLLMPRAHPTEQPIFITDLYNSYAEGDFSNMPLFALLGNSRKPFEQLQFPQNVKYLEQDIHFFNIFMGCCMYALLSGEHDPKTNKAKGNGIGRFFKKWLGKDAQLVKTLAPEILKLLDHFPVDNCKGENLFAKVKALIVASCNVIAPLYASDVVRARSMRDRIVERILTEPNFLRLCGILKKRLELSNGTYREQCYELISETSKHKDAVANGLYKETQANNKKEIMSRYMKEVLKTSEEVSHISSMSLMDCRQHLTKIRELKNKNLITDLETLKEVEIHTKNISGKLEELQDKLRYLVQLDISDYDPPQTPNENRGTFPRCSNSVIDSVEDDYFASDSPVSVASLTEFVDQDDVILAEHDAYFRSVISELRQPSESAVPESSANPYNFLVVEMPGSIGQVDRTNGVSKPIVILESPTGEEEFLLGNKKMSKDVTPLGMVTRSRTKKIPATIPSPISRDPSPHPCFRSKKRIAEQSEDVISPNTCPNAVEWPLSPLLENKAIQSLIISRLLSILMTVIGVQIVHKIFGLFYNGGQKFF
eukprot:TRINITY_DN9_c0_g3_i7.p1 TRINITY_DN9_c0_g3~~TRINITY_DN9_c0_g3_i7.p1  ORF type:complete len:1047 (+),score=150.87 TRINITY_DN9_c0_g3_i7:353-3493(+)